MALAVALPAGLCATCVHAKVLLSDRGSRFYRCSLSDANPRYARYPTLPVVYCQGYQPTVASPPRDSQA